jgi:hypothetical protein
LNCSAVTLPGQGVRINRPAGLPGSRIRRTLNVENVQRENNQDNGN